jgi:hypothetical protein
MRLNFKLAFTAAVVLTICVSVSPGAKAQDTAIKRLAADAFKFDATEFFTTVTAAAGANKFTPGSPDGALFYTKTVSVPRGSNTLYVTLYATADTHGGAAEWLSCRASPQTAPGVAPLCRPSVNDGANGTPSGWISLQKLPQDADRPLAANNCNNGGGGSADCHDNGIAYSWCVPVSTASPVVTVDLRMATSLAGQTVFIERGHVYIDSSFIFQPDRCQLLGPDPQDAELAAIAATGEEVAGSTAGSTTPGQQ